MTKTRDRDFDEIEYIINLDLASNFSNFDNKTQIMRFRPYLPMHVRLYRIEMILKDKNPYLPMRSKLYYFTLKVRPPRIPKLNKTSDPIAPDIVEPIILYGDENLARFNNS